MLRHFTPAQANKTLPLVKRIVAEIVERGRALREIVSRSSPTNEDRQEARDLEFSIRDLMKELEDIGCSYKDWGFEMGLVDFPAAIGGTEVLLCWRSDEDAVTWYHTAEGGFAGRRPIPEELLAREEH